MKGRQIVALFCELVVQISLFFTKISITIFLVENMASKCVANRTDIYGRMDRHGGSSNETIHHTKIDVNIAHSVRLSVCSVLVQQCNQHLLPPATSHQPLSFVRLSEITNHHHVHIHIPKCYGVCIFKAFINLPI